MILPLGSDPTPARLYEELSNQCPTPFQWKFDRTKLAALLARLRPVTGSEDASAPASRRQRNLIINYETSTSAAHRNCLASLARGNMVFLQAVSFQRP